MHKKDIGRDKVNKHHNTTMLTDNGALEHYGMKCLVAMQTQPGGRAGEREHIHKFGVQ